MLTPTLAPDNITSVCQCHVNSHRLRTISVSLTFWTEAAVYVVLLTQRIALQVSAGGHAGGSTFQVHHVVGTLHG